MSQSEHKTKRTLAYNDYNKLENVSQSEPADSFDTFKIHYNKLENVSQSELALNPLRLNSNYNKLENVSQSELS